MIFPELKQGDLQRHLKKSVNIYRQRRDRFCSLRNFTFCGLKYPADSYRPVKVPGKITSEQSRILFKPFHRQNSIERGLHLHCLRWAASNVRLPVTPASPSFVS